ncbi:MAG: DUF4357 domain-containing protein [Calothrix sp. SM1_5_4]|nr:DUF4357 domain-containing protein [Calothrix sp. SM1_5_4]
MSEFMDNIVFVLETLGLGYFPTQIASTPIPEAASERTISDPSKSDGMEFAMTLPKNLVADGQAQPKANMLVKDGVYILRAGSYVRSAANESFVGSSYHELWEQIVNSDAVEKTPNEGLLKTVRDIDFRSPSAAGAIVRGRATNGRIEWKRISDGLPLNECELEQVTAA